MFSRPDFVTTPYSGNNTDVNVRISLSNDMYNIDGTTNYSGQWLLVNDGQTYRIAKGSFENSAVQFRRDEVTNSFLEGKYTINALRENVTETLAVYVRGTTHYEIMSAVKSLTDAVSQIRFYMEINLGNVVKGWNCYASDYTVNVTHEFLHAKLALVTAQIVRDPVETITEEI